VTTRCTVSTGTRLSAGKRSETTDAVRRNTAGAGTRSSSLSRLDSKAARTAALTMATMLANPATSVTPDILRAAGGWRRLGPS
jgi:hypothetical protein